MNVKFFQPARDYLRFKKEYDEAWESVNTRGDLILRKDVEEFEQKLAGYVGTKYAVALSSGTDAIFLSLKALNIKGKVALPSHTFKATCGAVINAGLEPVLYDMDKSIGNIDFQAKIPVHIAGEIDDYCFPISIDNDVPIIEDACQAFGAVKNPITRVQCWSFYPAKLLGAKGDSGAITTNREDIYEYIREARNHFKTDNRDFGGNYRMDNLQAALLNVKFKYIDEILARRKEIAERYLEELKDLLIGLPNNQQGRVWQDFIIRIINQGGICSLSDKSCFIGEDHKCGKSKRNELYEYLKEQGIETMKNEYPFSPKYPKLPLAAKYEAETLRLPINETIENFEIEYIIEYIKEFFQK